MRYAMVGFGLAALVALAGCNLLRPGLGTRNDTPSVNYPPPTAAALVKYLDDNSQKVQSLRCEDLTLQASKGLGVLLHMDFQAKIACQGPRNFRLTAANPAGMDEVDVGSNPQEFWFWIKRNDPPYQFFCPYKALDDGQRVNLPFPFQPEWVLEALGMGTYGPAENYQLVVEDRANRFKLVRSATSPQGTPVRKIIVFNKYQQQGSSPQVTDFILMDAVKNKEICSAHILEVQTTPTGGLVPKRMELRYPAEGAKLTLRFTQTTFNAPLPETVFRRPAASQAYNLATGRLDGGLQQAGGPAPRYGTAQR
jgi:hypothetical protein